jgi:FKBP-type peptidyl-prolyl cis-trans isomerase
MKNSKSLLAILVLLGAAAILSSCKKTKTTTKDSIEYTYIKEGNEKAAQGDYLLYNLEISAHIDSIKKDTVIYATVNNPFPGYLLTNDSTPINNGMDEIMLHLRKGDSINFEAPAKVIFGDNFPPFLKEDQAMKVKIGAFEIMDEEGIQAYYEKVMAAEGEKSAERAKDRVVEEAATIEAYGKENGLDLQKTENGLYYVIEQEGTGDPVAEGDAMQVNYAGYLLDGTLFDTSWESVAKENGIYNENRPAYEPLPVSVGMGQVIPGWDEGLMLLKKGSKGKFIIPSPLGYGENGAGAMIPPNSILVFDVEVMEVGK